MLRQGRRIPTDFFTLAWQPAETFKYGVLVSRGIRPACRRNRLKRLYREAIRLSRSHLTKTGRLAVLPRVPGLEPKLERLVADVTRVFEQLNGEN